MEKFNEEEKEVWRTIDEFPNYEVSNLGRVKSIARTRKGKHNSIASVKERIMLPFKSKSCENYQKERIDLNGKKIMVHVLVAKAFPDICGDFFDGCEVHHKDFNPLNNRADNLKICTVEEHRFYHHDKKVERMKGENNPFYGKTHTPKTREIIRNKNSKNINQYTLDGQFVQTWKSCTEVERVKGWCKAVINRCCLCKPHNHTAYGYKWSYATPDNPD